MGSICVFNQRKKLNGRKITNKRESFKMLIVTTNMSSETDKICVFKQL